MDFPPVEINDQSIAVRIIGTANRNAYARVKDGTIIISLPSRITGATAQRVASDLYERIKRSIVRRPEQYLNNNLEDELLFNNNQNVNILGRSFTVRVLPSYSQVARGKMSGDSIMIAIPDNLQGAERQAMASAIARRIISKAMKCEIAERVQSINMQHFNSDIGRVRLSKASTRWGSCSSRKGEPARIMLNFKLLFMPTECLDYVIVHELAHTKVRRHSERFWSIVERVMPDYKERRKMLRSFTYNAAVNGFGVQQQQNTAVN